MKRVVLYILVVLSWVLGADVDEEIKDLKREIHERANPTRVPEAGVAEAEEVS